MEDLRAIRNFIYNGRNYSTNQLFQAPIEDAARLIVKRCAVRVSIAPGTPVTTPIQGENKMLKMETVSKPIPVSTAKPVTATTKRRPKHK